MGRLLGFVFGVASYAFFFGTFVYLIGFVGNLTVPKSIDAGPATATSTALAINVGLLLLFAVQHSVMARPWFKRAWTRVVPTHLERSVYVLIATAVLAVMMVFWRPMPATVWAVEHSVAVALLEGVFWAGWATVLLSTFLIDHFRLFGLKQVWANLRGRSLEQPRFQTPGLYRWVRHPLYLGFLMAFWAAPEMSAGRLLLTGVWTSWILLAIRLEERDLSDFHGDVYRAYRTRVGMLLPRLGGGAGRGAAHGAAPSTETAQGSGG